jgi:hypothetical protein
MRAFILLTLFNFYSYAQEVEVSLNSQEKAECAISCTVHELYGKKKTEEITFDKEELTLVECQEKRRVDQEKLLEDIRSCNYGAGKFYGVCRFQYSTNKPEATAFKIGDFEC